MEEDAASAETARSLSHPLSRRLPPINEVIPPPRGFANEAPPAYTPRCSTTSLNQLVPTPQEISSYTETEQKAMRVLGIGSAIMGSVSIFMSLLSVVFGTIMYCSGTGVWGGVTSTLNGIVSLMRLEHRNTRCQSLFLTILSAVAVAATIVSVVLAIIGTSNVGMAVCCDPSSKLLCNITASQMANTCIASLAFIQLVFGVMLGVFHTKYAFKCCNSTNDDFRFPPHFYLEHADREANMRYRLW